MQLYYYLSAAIHFKFLQIKFILLTQKFHIFFEKQIFLSNIPAKIGKETNIKLNHTTVKTTDFQFCKTLKNYKQKVKKLKITFLQKIVFLINFFLIQKRKRN